MGTQLQFTKISKRFEKLELFVAQLNKKSENYHNNPSTLCNENSQILDQPNGDIKNELEQIKFQISTAFELLNLKADRKDLENLAIDRSSN